MSMISSVQNHLAIFLRVKSKPINKIQNFAQLSEALGKQVNKLKVNSKLFGQSNTEQIEQILALLNSSVKSFQQYSKDKPLPTDKEQCKLLKEECDHAMNICIFLKKDSGIDGINDFTELVHCYYETIKDKIDSTTSHKKFVDNVNEKLNNKSMSEEIRGFLHDNKCTIGVIGGVLTAALGMALVSTGVASFIGGNLFAIGTLTVVSSFYLSNLEKTYLLSSVNYLKTKYPSTQPLETPQSSKSSSKYFNKAAIFIQ